MKVNGWQSYSFADLIDQGVLLVGDGYRAKLEELGGSGPLFLRAGHVTDSHIDFANVDRFHDELEPKVRGKMSQPGDVVITTKGNSTGRVTYVTPELPPFVYSPHLSFWRSLQTDRLVPGFLRCWSRCPEFRHQLAALACATDMAPYLSLIDQRRLLITVPPPDVQRTIAQVLSSLDDKIELNRQMNETLEATAQAFFTSWFVDEIDNGATNKWRIDSLDKIATYLNGLALQRFPPNGGDSLPVIKIAQLRSGNTEGSDRASARVDPAYIIEDGDVLFSWSGSLEVVLWCGGRGALNQHLFKISSSEFPKWFYYLWTKHHLPEFQAIAAGKATTMGHIQRHHLTDAKVFIPSPNDLDEMTAKISPLIEKIIANNIESRTLTELRDALLPKLMSGQLRIPSDS